MSEPAAGYGGTGWRCGSPHDYDREYCVDRVQLAAFLHATQPEAADSLALDENGPTRRKFLARLQGEIAKRGTIDVLRHGIEHGAHHLELFYGTPSAGNEQARERFGQNRFTVTRQLHYSLAETQRALDIGLFINGLPVFTFELKNSLTKQTVDDAIWQYRKDRNPREQLFEFGRCVAHFAVDESEVRFCTHLKGKASWFLPFNRGWNDGAGNPPNPDGIKTDYLWHDVLGRESLTNILENYAQVVAAKDAKTGRKRRTQVWPRYHQLDVVRGLVEDVAAHGAGRRYLVQHSAGSGKSNSIAWLAHQLIGLSKDDALVFDSIVVVTDRVILDKQINDTIRQYAQVGATVAHADRSGDLRRFIEAGKKIIISTVQKFPFILDEIDNEQRGRRFAIIIDEAHSSQGGRTSSSISVALGTAGEEDEEETCEDRINRVMESRKLLRNASYFAFTATPKSKTLEIFGAPDPQPDGTVRHHAFHSYTMELDEDGQVAFKGNAKGFVRTYAFLASVLPYSNPGWEKRSIFLNFLIPRLPVPDEDDLSKGILDAIDMDSYRVEKRAMQKIVLPDVDAEVDPVPTSGGGSRPEPEMDCLSNILRTFNDLFGDIDWDDADRVRQFVTETIPARVAADTAFRNAMLNSDAANTRIEHDKALLRVMTSLMKDDTELFKQFMDNAGFKQWMTKAVFELACKQAGPPLHTANP